MNYHLMDIMDVTEHFSCNPDRGLEKGEAARRLERHGRNELQDRGGKSPWIILREQFCSTMALLLTGAALLSGIVGSRRDAAAIMAIVCLFALLGFVQEYRAERAMRALKRLAVPFVRVRRDGDVAVIPSLELVPGDLVLLEAGNVVPADCRLLESYNLKALEAVLTGEADAVEKSGATLTGSDLPLGDRLNMLYMGTTITYGRCLALVTATGMSTELGRIAALMQGVEQGGTPLQRRLDRLGKMLASMAVAVALIFFVIGVMRGEEVRLLLMTAVSLAVAAIPEGLPAVVTITLALGSQRMLRRRALIRKLPAVETLGSVTVICSDKTGTLTENRMTVTETIGYGDQPDGVMPLLSLAALCNDASLRDEGGRMTVVGDPTEGALLVAAAALGQHRPALESILPRTAEVPFDSSTKRMVTVHLVAEEAATHPLAGCLGLAPGDRLIAVKGAPEGLLSLCRLEARELGRIREQIDELSSRGRRVLAVAANSIRAGRHLDLDTCLDGLRLMGFVAMMDPPRPEAGEAVACCLKAGIRPVMITGDHPMTACSVAGTLGIGGNGRVLTGNELDRIGLAGLASEIGEVSIYSRVSPEHKLLIVQALQERGDVVAMTGDGVNDAPALKKADIGVAMGITGTDVAKEAADMVLLDDNFATIVSAVEEGRTIFDNIRKFIEFSVAGNLGKILAVLVLPFLGLPIPLTPLQLLWLNLLTDGLLGLGMGVERPEPDVMRRPPLPPAAQIFDRRTVRHTLLTGAIIGTATILLTRHYWANYPGHTWQTVLFASLAFAQVGQAMALRSPVHSFFRMGLFSNPLLLAMVCGVVVLQGAVIYLPPLQPFFKTEALTLETLGLVMMPGCVLFMVLEAVKFLTRGDGRSGG